MDITIFFAQSRLTVQLSFGLHAFELLRTLVVDCHDGMALAALRGLTL